MSWLRGVQYVRARSQRQARLTGEGLKPIGLGESHLRGRIWQGTQLILRGWAFELRTLKPRTLVACALAWRSASC